MGLALFPKGWPWARRRLGAAVGRLLGRFGGKGGEDGRLLHRLPDTAEAVAVTDRNWRTLQVNPAFTRITGYGEGELLACHLGRLLAGEAPGDLFRSSHADLAEKGAWCGEAWARRKDGILYRGRFAISVEAGADGCPGHYVIIHSDLSRRRSEEELIRHLLEYDPLTGLLNWSRLQERLAETVAAAGADWEVALLMLDLDHFRAINEAMGYQMGDYILQAMAERIVRHAGPGTLVARRGADEFCIVAPPSRQARERAAGLADTLLAAVAEPLPSFGREHRLTASIGISIYPGDGGEAANLLRYADVATDQAKQSGRNSFRFFSPAMKLAMEEKLTLEIDLHQAVERSQLVLHYQPLVDVASGRLAGVEALVRWQHPDFGLVSPARFISLAEECGAISAIGEWALREACRQGRIWHLSGHPELQVAVNLSPIQFRQSHFPARVDAILAETGFDPACLDLEITEGAIMQEPEQAAGILHQFKRRDIQISVDDFGTGYSSLAYLKRFPIDRLKIDRSFVAACHEDRHDRAIIDTIVRLARNLKLEVVAEGVESEEQLAFLRGKTCDFAQGYLFSPPVPALQIEALLDAQWAGDPARSGARRAIVRAGT